MTPAPPHVLVADDDPAVLTGLARVLRAASYRVSEAADGAAALRRARRERPDVALLDVHMPGRSGLELLAELRRLSAAPSVVLMTGMADVPMAVGALRDGAADFLEKPVDRTQLEAVMRRVLAARGPAAPPEPGGGSIVGGSPGLRRVLEQVRRVASTPRSTVLVLGESGVGKELVARAIHDASDRADRPFLALNCAALSEPLLEAELFGYEPGTFTGGAPRGRDGLLAAAEGGTLLLDEVGELAPALQAKLLRVLQERSYRRVGATADRPMDVRVVASTHRDLEREVEAGRFREDLYYRLNVLCVVVPPLRERREDVRPLAEHFLRAFSAELGRPAGGFEPAALEALARRDWPGNVRELRNVVERAALLAGTDAAGAQAEIGPALVGTAGEADLLRPARPASRADAQEAGAVLHAPDLSLRSVERALVQRVLEETGGNRSAAARMLGVNRTTLYNKLRAFGL